ncbi:MAG: hypothetical protein UX09_C0020G0002 [Candidatus Uhrbacteria bacterium GW2011_GWE2_45_35]|uniref:Uncharacterized protein n=2 Tax=Candidatus Uhriibacteriota TaxID=1752732 RepID=A0A0G1MET8_9BACT|nr:MAG: hypothetical protein UW63_C0025G0001 [Candidatus Uhrbacteria bacterium GW2011_GWF2_44_350]KKU08131.1 MAG: hypothetical protein UX09_C0020G0002 [Candidatus Uhrbacteria bacterium GW2011_GWE2_45_35]HBR80841.1 hypothetical protein [Candidatus Uhrbacteria bacterium]HCU31366.1 hypothetical protein [Candidatus Uhrbacteria bacterium]
MRNTNSAHPLSINAEIGIQLDRAVRPARRSLAIAEVRVVAVEVVVLDTADAFKAADAALQRLSAKQAPAEEIAAAEAARREALAAKRLAAKRLAFERGLREQADRRLSEAEVYLDYLSLSVEPVTRRLTAPLSREQSVMAEALRRAGVDPVSARQAATAPAK